MDEKDLRTTGVEIEEGFRNFIKRLLEAESYDFMKEKALFSPTTLKSTLEEFCNIIADELDCDSCTIQLKVYDSKMMDKEFLNKLILDHFIKASKSIILEKIKLNKKKGKKVSIPKEFKDNENNFLNLLKEWWEMEIGIKTAENKINDSLNEFINNYLKKEDKDKIPDYLREFKKSRINWLKSPLVFPYWYYVKGVAGSVAANNTSPWLTLYKDEKNDLKYVTLKGGVSRDIFQENAARVRDRLSIRETRNFRKLGAADMIVWNNTDWKYVFKNFYGIPIRIHSGGEVIGILRVENKWTYGKEKEEIKIIEDLLNTGNTKEFINGIEKEIDEKFKECGDWKKLNVSFLSLVYLENDLGPNAFEKNSMFIPYPDYIINILRRIKEDLLSGNADEEDSFDCLKNEVSQPSENLTFLKELFSKKKILCDILKDFLAFCTHDEKEKLSKELKCIIDLKISDNGYRPFPKKIEEILGKFETKINDVKEMSIKSLIPQGDNRPPIQLFTSSIDDEKMLWGRFVKKSSSCKTIYKKISALYNILKIHIDNNYKENKLERISILANEIEKLMIRKPKVKITPKSWLEGEGDKLPDFHFKLSLKIGSKKKNTIDLYIVVPPKKNEIAEIFKNNEEKLNHYEVVNKIWLKNEDTKLNEFCKHRQHLKGRTLGEIVIFDDSKEKIKVTDLIIYRLAARVQAFADALPIKDFSLEDTYKLKWAAFEIGKLIEREISYRANRYDDPMPLTAMEFYRIPISDFSFVDDLSSRRDNSKKTAANIDVYIKNIISQMEMKDSVKYSSRIKGYRSSLQRIGERFEDYVRGNIAIWVFLLLFAIEKSEKYGKKHFKKNDKLKDDDGKRFLKHIEKFRKNIEELLDDPNFFRKYFQEYQPNEIYGDAKFDSPPFTIDEEYPEERLIEAFNRIRANLESAGIYGDDFNDINDSTVIDNYFSQNKELFNDLLLRNYSYFIRDSLSLLVQIANFLKSLKNNEFDGFKEFYKKCRELRELLCSSFRELEGKDKYKLEKIFGLQEKPEEGGSWRKIKEFINKYNTGDVFTDDEDNYLQLTPKSIYKRIRMLNNILHYQVPAAHLDWELARFDLYGARMNCLFKNQVFVLYEKIWNKGDPFFIYEPEAKEFKEYYSEKGKIDTNKYRQRWLCLRTNILAGEYNACQIAALVDPKTVEPGYWEDISCYNLKSAQYVLGKIFNKFERTAAEKYRNYSWHRHLISECYRKWYQFKSKMLKRETQNDDKDQKKTKWYGSFLFASVINLLMLMLNCIIDHKNNKDKKNPNVFKNDNLNKGIENRHGFSEKTLKNIVLEMEKDINSGNLFFKIINAFYCIIKNASSYSNCIKEGFMKEELFSLKQFHCRCSEKNNKKTTDKIRMWVICEENDTENCALYKNAIKIIENIIKNYSTDNLQESSDKEIFEKIKKNLEKEKKFFKELKVSNDKEEGFQIPLFFFDENQKDSAGQSTLDNLKEICEYLKKNLKRKKRKKIKVNYWDFIYITLKRIRREQRTYLFDKGEKEKNYAGLWMREKTEVLNRIKNYVLLFSEKDIDDKNKNLFPGWNAHDLYYYIRSLIPMEIQVRTELADTFAVQYHDDIYKVQTPIGTEFPHTMLKRAGETLDRTDKELEIDYEDYILNVHHRIKEEDLD